MAASRKSKLSTKRKRGESRVSSPSLGRLTAGVRAEKSSEQTSGELVPQTAVKPRELDRPTVVAEPSPVCAGVPTELCELRQRLAKYWPVYNNWQNLTDLDLPVLKSGTSPSNIQDLDPDHGTCSIGGISFKWSPLPQTCHRWMQRKRVEFGPALLKDPGRDSHSSEKTEERQNPPNSAPTDKLIAKPACYMNTKQQKEKAQVLQASSSDRNAPRNEVSTKASQAIPSGGTKRKTCLQKKEVEGTVIQGVGTDMFHSSGKSQRAVKMDDLGSSMHKDVQREQPKCQPNKVQGPVDGGKSVPSQMGGLETFSAGVRPTGRSSKPTRVAPLFKRPASSRQPNVAAVPSTSRGLSEMGGAERLESGRGNADVLRSCPMCQEQFPHGMSQLDMDGHIAACLSASSEDIMW